jgi:hypothetical protein
MTQVPNIDGILITWGDRLFYPGNRIVKTKPQPKLTGDAARQRAAAIRERIEATVVRRAPQVMVKVTGGGRGIRAIAAHFLYTSKNIRFDIEEERGNNAQLVLANDWRREAFKIRPPTMNNRRRACVEFCVRRTAQPEEVFRPRNTNIAAADEAVMGLFTR